MIIRHLVHLDEQASGPPLDIEEVVERAFLDVKDMTF
jgi:hypothetical protein